MTLAYVSSPLDRAHDLRLKPDAISGLKARSERRLVRVRGDLIETRGGRPHFSALPATPEEVFLGLASDGTAWFAALAPVDAEFTPLRGLMLEGAVDGETLSILAQARSLVHWHERHGFCAHCGHVTAMADSGYRRFCENCKAEHFPRTDPVVIIAVTHDDAILLGRQASWGEGMYSALAGFVEPGETLEQAARREVYEEAGIRVGAIDYVASQPWPFPSSLMIGLIGRAETSEIKIDSSEIQDARWFSKADIRLMLARQHPQGFFASHPYAIAHVITAAALEG